VLHEIAELVTALGAAVTAAGVLLLWKQIDLLKEQAVLLKDQVIALKNQAVADHDRSRRENAINYLFEWSRGLFQSASLARRLAEGLTEQQTLELIHERPLRLSAEKKNLVLGVLSKVPQEGLLEQNGEITLKEREVSDVRWQLVRYLNILESIFAAARHNVADKDILIEEFGFLHSPTEGFHLLKKFRDAMGADSYPALMELDEELEQRRKLEKGKEPTDKKFR